MARNVISGLIQASNPINDESRSVADIQAAAYEKHLPMIHDAGKQGVQILCLQEIFNGPYFCPGQDRRWYDAAEPVPGPTLDKLVPLARKYQMAMVVPLYEREQAGVYYNTAAILDADGSYLGKYRKTHIPQTAGFWEKYFFRPGNLGYPVFQTAVGKIGVYICYDRHFPDGARALGLNGAEIVLIPSATSRGLSEYLWRVEQVSHSLANGYFVGTINRVGVEKDIGDDDFYGQSYFVDPLGQFIGPVGSPHDEELIVRDLDLDLIEKVRQTWQFYRDRRPDAYDDLTRP
jgi:N-carbamoylputrescine amidase